MTTMNAIAPSELIVNKNGTIYHLNLRPEDLADNIIAVGDPERVAKVSRHFDSIELEVHKREFVTHTGYYKGKRVTAISTGMGTDNIEIFMTELDALANIDLQTRIPNATHKTLNIVRVGTSGGLQENVALDSELASATGIGLDTLMCFYDFQPTEQEANIGAKLQQDLGLPFRPYVAAASSELLEKIAFDIYKGNTLTCPGFYAPQGRELRLKTAIPNLVSKYQSFDCHGFKVTNFEMETAAYYAMGRMLGHNMLSLNAIVAQRVQNLFSTQAETVIDSLIVKTLERM